MNFMFFSNQTLPFSLSLSLSSTQNNLPKERNPSLFPLSPLPKIEEEKVKEIEDLNFDLDLFRRNLNENSKLFFSILGFFLFILFYFFLFYFILFYFI